MNITDLKQIEKIINKALKKAATKDDLKNFATKDDLKALEKRLELKIESSIQKSTEEICELIIDFAERLNEKKAERTDIDDLNKRVNRIEKQLDIV